MATMTAEKLNSLLNMPEFSKKLGGTVFAYTEPGQDARKDGVFFEVKNGKIQELANKEREQQFRSGARGFQRFNGGNTPKQIQSGVQGLLAGMFPSSGGRREDAQRMVAQPYDPKTDQVLTPADIAFKKYREQGFSSQQALRKAREETTDKGQLRAEAQSAQQAQGENRLAQERFKQGQQVSGGASMVENPLTKTGLLIKDPNELRRLTEDDLARTTIDDIFKRDLALEQELIGTFSQQHGKPQSDQDWRVFHDFVYRGVDPNGETRKATSGEKTEIEAQGATVGVDGTVFDQGQAGATGAGVGVDGAGVFGEDGQAGNEFDLPESIANSAEFQSLTDDEKALLELKWTAIVSKQDETKQRASDAFDQALAEVSPFSRVLVKFALDQIPDQFSTTKLSLENQLTNNQETLAEIDKIREDLPLEQQQQLNEISRNFERNIEGVEEQMADRGLSFSTKRTDLENFIGQQNLELVQSTKRGFSQRIREVDRAKKQTERQQELTRKAGEAQLKQIARGAEEVVGTERAEGLDLKGLGGEAIKPIGGTDGTKKFIGTLEQQRREKVAGLTESIKNLDNPQAVENLFNQ